MPGGAREGLLTPRYTVSLEDVSAPLPGGPCRAGQAGLQGPTLEHARPRACRVGARFPLCLEHRDRGAGRREFRRHIGLKATVPPCVPPSCRAANLCTRSRTTSCGEGRALLQTDGCWGRGGRGGLHSQAHTCSPLAAPHRALRACSRVARRASTPPPPGPRPSADSDPPSTRPNISGCKHQDKMACGSIHK